MCATCELQESVRSCRHRRINRTSGNCEMCGIHIIRKQTEVDRNVKWMDEYLAEREIKSK